MSIIWNEEKVVIQWLEPRKDESPLSHYFSRKPIKLQLHPTTNEVIRVHFKGEMPAWIKRYVDASYMRAQNVVTNEGNGWWIAKWMGHKDMPILSPNIKGALVMWIQQFPEEYKVFDKYKERLLENIDLIEQNLIFHHEDYRKYGFHFRPEELTKDGGVLFIEDDVIPEVDLSESESDYERRFESSQFPALVRELVDLKEIPDFDEEEVIAIENTDDDEEFVLDLSLDDTDEELEEIVLEDVDDGEDVIVLDDNDIDEDVIVLDDIVVVDEDIAEEIATIEESEEVVSNEHDTHVDSEAVDLPVAEDTEQPSVSEEDTGQLDIKDVEPGPVKSETPKVAKTKKTTAKKEKMVSGQMFLF